MPKPITDAGFTLDELYKSQEPGIRALLGETDLLVDGPFEREHQASLLWRGSSNQHIHLLSSRYAHLAPHMQGPSAGVELRIDSENNLFWAGVPDRDFVARLARAAQKHGIIFTGQEGVWA